MTSRMAPLAAVLLSVLGARVLCAERAFTVGPVPAWVERIGPGRTPAPAASDVADGIYYRLLDTQARLAPSGLEEYHHVVREIVTEGGLESASQLKVEFDPSFQSVELHGVQVRRGGRAMDRLHSAQVKVLQREPDLEAQTYDGSLSLVLFVEDLRVGDVIDHAFTVRGANPVYERRFHDSVALEWSVPLHRSRFRLLFPAGRSISTRSHGTSLGPSARRLGDWREFVFDRLDPVPVPGDAATPVDHVTWGWVQLSEWPSWVEVARWGAGLFAFPERPPAALRAQLERWRVLGEAAGVHAALRFVQDDVRYLAIELGAGSHRPRPPDLVAARRFGDCKDKVLLFCTLARALGAGCTPALVSTSGGRALEDWLPSPGGFDHVVARVGVAGRTYWVDPTLAAQGGGPGESHFPDYQRALLLSPGVEGLSSIPLSRPRRPMRTVHDRIRADDTKAPADFVVETRLLGSEADELRFELRRSSRDEVSRGWLGYYSKFWPRIRFADAVVIEDDRQANVVVTREHYSIPDFWTPIEGDEARREADFSALTLSPYLRKPPTSPRSAPVRITHPVFVRHVTEVTLPAGLELEPGSHDWSAPELRFSYRSAVKEGTLVAEYELETLRDRVGVERLPAHLETVEALASYLDWHLEHPRPRARVLGGGPNWPVLAIAALVGTLGLAGSVLVLLHARREGASWTIRVIAVIAGLVTASLLVIGLARSLPLYSSTAWVEATSAGHEQYRAAWAPVLLAALATRILLLAGCLLVPALLLRGRRFRGLLLAVLLATLLLCFAEGVSYALLAGARSAFAHGAARDALVALGTLFFALPAALTPARASRR